MRIPDSAIFLDPLPSLVTGVDFLGLAALNERLVALCLPGISNVTRYMRAYSAMSWMAWRFSEHLKKSIGGSRVSERDIQRAFRRFREKVELLFTLGNPDFSQIAGQTRRTFLPDGVQRFPLEFKAFGDYKISWLDAAVYGPSLNSDSGLGFLQRAPGIAYRPTPRGEELATALDESLRRSVYYGELADVERNTGTNAMVKDLGKRWAVRGSSAKERTAFRKAFFPDGAGEEGSSLHANRVAMLKLVIRALRALRGRGTVDEVRQTIARGADPNGRSIDLSACEKTQSVWAVLQIRQLQRLAHEALLRWLELVLLDPPADLKGLTARHLADLAGMRVAKYFKVESTAPLSTVFSKLNKGNPRDYYLAGLARPEIDPFAILADLLGMESELQDQRLPGAAVYALALCCNQAKVIATKPNQERWLEAGGRSRLSLKALVDLFAAYSDSDIAIFSRVLIESCVVGQHLAVTAAKLEPGKNKYRFITTESGLRLLIRPNQVTRLAVTGDRLENAMELMMDCGLLEWDDASGRFSLAAGAEARA